MSTGDFHNRPFDDGTLTKLEIFELYAREWFPVFLAQNVPSKSIIHVYDFFAGPGTDSSNKPGSPLRIIRQLQNCQKLAAWGKVKTHLHFFDKSSQKINQLKQIIDEQVPKMSNVSYDIKSLAFEEAWEKSAQQLNDQHAAKLVFIDQTGVSQVTDDVFSRLVKSQTCDFLFFISSSTLYRFLEHPAISLKISRPDDYYHVHRAALDYYRRLIPSAQRYYLAPFSIKKGANIHGIIFGSGHPRGMDKFLQVAWKSDEMTGEADFDINRENIKPDQLRLPHPDFRPSKILVFEKELENLLRNGSISTELDVIQVCFDHGMKRKHAEPVLKKLKEGNIINLKFRIPDIKRLNSPRPIRLI
ncbi:MAG: hypothetical protein NPIRA04_21030 [Nitrospirales bacterium]|nr:MAG: hypothetical protein NPIRA04_21030 [Nitrospirales bacterium]